MNSLNRKSWTHSDKICAAILTGNNHQFFWSICLNLPIIWDTIYEKSPNHMSSVHGSRKGLAVSFWKKVGQCYEFKQALTSESSKAQLTALTVWNCMLDQ